MIKTNFLRPIEIFSGINRTIVLCAISLTQNIFIPEFCFSFQTPPNEVKDGLNLKDKAAFRADDLVLETKLSGLKKPRMHHRIYCQHCQTETLPELLQKYNEYCVKSLLDLINMWDSLKVWSTFIFKYLSLIDHLGFWGHTLCWYPNKH